jgi:hypothetical protein
MSRSFQINAGQSVVASLNERTIYIKVSDSVNYTVYESNIELKELRLSLDLEDAYKIIVKCLEGSSGPVASKGCLEGSKGCLEGSKGCLEGSEGSYKGDYRVITSVNSGSMKMSFSARVEGFLKINFDIILKEKIMSNDGQLTLSMNRIEQKQTMAIETLTKKCADLEDIITKQQQDFAEQLEFLRGVVNNCQIFMTNIYTPQGNWCNLQSTSTTTHMNTISAKEITMQDHGQTIWENISVFYQLSKLTITNFNAGNNITNLTKFSNANLKELVLNCCAHGSFTSLQGIENFPNLEILTITSAPGLTNVVKVLTDAKHANKMLKFKHAIKTLKFQGCNAVNVVELQTYCQVNGIFLALS